MAQLPHPAHVPQPAPPRHPARPKRRRKANRRALWWMLGALGLGTVLLFGLLTIGLAVAASRIPANVSVAGLRLGGMTSRAAQQALSEHLVNIPLRDGSEQWRLPAAELGLTFDAAASVRAAKATGLRAWFTPVAVPPAVSVNPESLTLALTALQSSVDRAPKNASIHLVNGRVEPVPAVNGRALDIAATVQAIASDPASGLADGVLELVTTPILPSVADAAPLVNQAQGVLNSPLRVRAYDPFAGRAQVWESPPEQWSTWLITEADSANPLGMRLALEPNALANFLSEQAALSLPSYQTLNLEDAAAAIQAGLANLTTETNIRLYETDRTHTVQAGETITSIAWDYGIPYPYIQAANGGISGLSAGQTITIPSREVFLEYPVIPNKRIVVSISGQWTQVYQDGGLLWDWVSSTGIQSSPTWPGVYQVILHEQNAYAGNWNLYMPYFIGVYKPLPQDDFTNGFHGFPTRAGGQLLWENSLGTRVTYGCILLNNTNARLLYDWAEEGVIVEILP